SKDGVENSYNAPDAINMVRWHNYGSIKKLKQLLKLRKNYKVYRYDTYKQKGIKASIQAGYILYTLKTDRYTLAHYIKNDFNDVEIPLNGKMIFKSRNVKTT